MGGLQKQVPEPESWGSGIQACLEIFWNIACNISSSHVLVSRLGTLLYFYRLILLFALTWHSSVPHHEPLLAIEIFFKCWNCIDHYLYHHLNFHLQLHRIYHCHLERYWSINVNTALYTDTTSWYMSHQLVFSGDLFDILSGIYTRNG